MRLALNPEFLRAAPKGWESWDQTTALEDKSAEAMIIRSTLTLDSEAVTARPHLKYVATASSGTCHLDIPLLENRGIQWMSCPGSNAEAVADWVAIALHRLGFSGGTLGIIGAGQVGQRVAARYRGGEVLLCDPPRAALEKNFPHVPLDELIERSDVLSLHCPLDASTHAMIDRTAIASFRGKALLNAARGGIVTERAVKLLKARGCRIALDVFPDEPNPRRTWFEVADFVTPHIAGHTDAAKENALIRCAQWISERAGVPTRITPKYVAAPGKTDTILDLAHSRLMAGEAFRAVRTSSLRPPLRMAPAPDVMV